MLTDSSYGDSAQNASDYTCRGTYYQDMHRPDEGSTQNANANMNPATMTATAANSNVQGSNESNSYNHHYRGESSGYGVYVQAPENHNWSESSHRASDWMSSPARPRSHSHWDTCNAVSSHSHPLEQEYQWKPWAQEACHPINSTIPAFLADDDDLWALDYPITETRQPVQQRLEAMAGTMALQDTQEPSPTLVVSRFFRAVDDKELLSNVTATPHWNSINGDPVFAVIPTNGEITTFEELHKRKQTMASEASSLYFHEEILQEGSPWSLSFDQEEATPSVTRPPRSLRPHIQVDASTTRHIGRGHLSPVLLNYDDQDQTADPPSNQRQFRGHVLPQERESSNHDGWGIQQRSYQGDYGRQHQNRSQRQQKNKQAGRQSNTQRRRPRGSHQSHYHVDFGRHNNHRQDNRPGRQWSGRNRPGKNNNNQGQKHPYENSAQYVRGEERCPEKRRKLN